MAAIWQVTWRWTGFPGAPGFTNLFFLSSAGDGTEALAAVNKSRLLFTGVAGKVAAGITITPQSDVRLISDVDGALLDIFTVVGVDPVTGGSPDGYPAPAGGCIDWLTTTVHAGRRMQGRTFIVPLGRNEFDAQGTLATAVVTAFATAAEAMRTAAGPAFGVWGRPRPADPNATPPRPAVDGLWGPAVSSRVPDLVATLRSRRD